MALLMPSQTHWTPFLPSERAVKQADPGCFCRQGAASGATTHQIPAQMEPFILTDAVSKIFHFLRNFCNVLSWRNAVISPHKAELMNRSIGSNEPRYFFSSITFCMHVTSIMCLSDSNLKTFKLL